MDGCHCGCAEVKQRINRLITGDEQSHATPCRQEYRERDRTIARLGQRHQRIRRFSSRVQLWVVAHPPARNQEWDGEIEQLGQWRFKLIPVARYFLPSWFGRTIVPYKDNLPIRTLYCNFPLYITATPGRNTPQVDMCVAKLCDDTLHYWAQGPSRTYAEESVPALYFRRSEVRDRPHFLASACLA